MINFSWSAEDTGTAARMWAARIPASKIAAELGITRSAVIGKMHRLGLSGTRPIQKPKPRAYVKRDRNRFVAEKPKPLPLELILLTLPSTPGSRPVTLVEADASHCRWPLGDPHNDDFRFCGAEKDFDHSYCAHHHKIAYEPRSRGVAKSRPSYRVEVRV